MDAVTKRCVSTATRLPAEGTCRYNGYEAVFNEWVTDPVIEVLPEEEFKNPAYYLSHQGVFKNSMTKIKTGVWRFMQGEGHTLIAWLPWKGLKTDSKDC